MKRFIAFLCILTMLMSMMCIGYAEDSTTGSIDDPDVLFPDVTTDDPYYKAIHTLGMLHIIDGYEDGTFRSKNDITRAEFLKLLMSMENAEVIGFLPDDTLTGFPDVDDIDHWAKKYIKLAIEQKIVIGYEDGTFRPEDNVAVEEAIKMMVCYLNYEGPALEIAAGRGLPEWPDAYMEMGLDLRLNTVIGVDYRAGIPAPRGMVAQILYNGKDIPKYIAPITPPPASTEPGSTATPTATPNPPGGGGGGGGGGGTITRPTTKPPTVYKGIVVGVRDFWIDDTARAMYGNLAKQDMVIRLTNITLDGSEYVHVTASSSQYPDTSRYFGKAVDFTIETEIGIHTIATLSFPSSSSSGNRETTISSDMIDRIRTTESDFYYYNSSGALTRLRLPANINGLKVMFNGKMLETPDSYGYIVKLEDLMPEEGQVVFIDAQSDGSYDLIKVTSYEDYIVGGRSVNDKYITDLYRKDGNGAALRLYIDTDDEDNVSMINKSTDKSITISGLSNNDSLLVAQSRDGQKKTIYVSRADRAVSGKLRGGNIDEKSITIDLKEYEISSYFKQYILPSMDLLELENTITIYINASNRVIGLKKAEIAYQMGYVITGYYGTGDRAMRIQLLTTNSSLTPSDAEYEFAKSIRVNGIKGLDQYQIDALIRAGAADINKGKPEKLTKDSSRTQPIRYYLEGGKITAMELLYTYVNDDYTKPIKNENFFIEEDYRVITTDDKDKALIYKKSENKFGNMTIYSDSMIFYVPNDRTNTKLYSVGTRSAFSNKLVANKKYNAESYVVKKADGETTRMIVVYNEDLDEMVDFDSPVQIVKAFTNKSVDGEIVEQITMHDNSVVVPADEARMGVMIGTDGNRIEGDVRKVERGDVIRYGYKLNGKITNIEILLDASAATSDPLYKDADFLKTSLKILPYNKMGSYIPFTNDDNLYYDDPSQVIRCGVLTKLDIIMYENYDIKIDPTNKTVVALGDLRNSIRAYMYDMNEREFNLNYKYFTNGDDNCNPEVGDILFVYQAKGTSDALSIKFMYLIKPVPILLDALDDYVKDALVSAALPTLITAPMGLPKTSDSDDGNDFVAFSDTEETLEQEPTEDIDTDVDIDPGTLPDLIDSFTIETAKYNFLAMR